MPATFSTALPAIATTTIPANACDTCNASIAGSSAATNHSDTSAAPTDATTSTVTAIESGQPGSASTAAGLSPCLSERDGSALKVNRRLAANTINSRIAQAALNAPSCLAA